MSGILSLRPTALALCILPVLGIGGAKAAEVFVVHGIPGDDLGLPSELIVDIAANGSCLLPGASFRDVAGPVDLDPGGYDISISLADTSNPCGGAIAVTGAVDVAVAPVSIVLAHLDQNGGPTITKFTSKTSSVAADQARLTVYHTAAVSEVDLQLIRNDHDRIAAVQGLANGEQTFPVDVPADSYEVKVSPASGHPGRFEAPLAEIPVTLGGGTATAVFAVGSLDNNTFGVIPVAVIP